MFSQRTLLSEQVGQYQALRVQQEDTIYGAQPQSDFERRIGDSLIAAGLSRATRYSARTEADQEHRDSKQQLTGLRQRRASVEIQGLQPQQIGSLLAYWHDSQHMWIPDRIQLAHDSSSNRNLYSLRLECIAVYHAQERE